MFPGRVEGSMSVDGTKLRVTFSFAANAGAIVDRTDTTIRRVSAIAIMDLVFFVLFIVFFSFQLFNKEKMG
jgi:hypothetical protein